MIFIFTYPAVFFSEDNKKKERLPLRNRSLSDFVGATRFELATSTSRTWRATNCAIPRIAVQNYSFIAKLQI